MSLNEFVGSMLWAVLTMSLLYSSPQLSSLPVCLCDGDDDGGDDDGGGDGDDDDDDDDENADNADVPVEFDGL